MKTNFYLIVNSKGGVKTTKNRPGIDWDEISIKMELLLPDNLFSKPQLQASISIKDGQITPTLIDAEMTNNIQEAIQQHTGVPIRLKIVSEPDDKK